MKNPKGTLFLIPSTMGDSEPERVLPAFNMALLQHIDVYIVEELRTARRFLRKCGYKKDFETTTFHLLNEHTHHEELHHMLDEALNGKDIGVLSEAGCPAVADPGSLAVRMAHEMGIKVVPLAGPSSIIMGLMASGFNGQYFTFHGYLPVKEADRIKKIKELERDMYRTNQTHIFIEAPYRNKQMIGSLLSSCSDTSMLCIASNLSLADEFVRSASIAFWKKNIPDPGKKPTVYLLSK